ncbi:MAG: anti-sigma factor [Chloroflexi bacterium]|nr:anti-sigma factor [Chloroflexota bacterium]
MNDERLQELLAAAALGHLDETDRAALDKALAEDPSLHDEFDELNETAALLAYGVEPAALDLRVREAVLRRARDARDEALRPVDSGWRNPLSLIFAGLSAVAVAAAVVIAVLLGGRLAEMEGATVAGRERASKQVAALQTLVEDGGAGVTLSGTENAPDATAFLLMTSDKNVAVLICSGLKKLSRDRAYQLWLANPDGKMSGGMLNADSDGFAMMVVQSPMPFSMFQSFGVTVEPAEGSPGPTGDMVLGSDL